MMNDDNDLPFESWQEIGFRNHIQEAARLVMTALHDQGVEIVSGAITTMTIEDGKGGSWNITIKNKSENAGYIEYTTRSACYNGRPIFIRVA